MRLLSPLLLNLNIKTKQPFNKRIPRVIIILFAVNACTSNNLFENFKLRIYIYYVLYAPVVAQTDWL